MPDMPIPPVPPVIPGNGEEVLGSPWLTDPGPVAVDVAPEVAPIPDTTAPGVYTNGVLTANVDATGAIVPIRPRGHPRGDPRDASDAMTPASILSAIPDDVLRAGDGINQRHHQSIRLARYFEQRGHRPTWAEIINERARRAK